MDEATKTEFRRGFYPHRLARWAERISDESGAGNPDIAGCLIALADGKRDFSYPRHDEQVHELLHRLVPSRKLVRGADIGCATGCFPAMQLSAGVEECTVFEVRPTETNDSRVIVRIEDLTYAETFDSEFDLVTCLSTIEHVGLGRYGDPIDPWGDVKMAASLRRILKPGGLLLLSFPVGIGTVVYNAHRIYSRHRRNTLFGDLRVVGWRPGRSWVGFLRHKAELATRKLEVSSQPIYVLERSAPARGPTAAAARR
jgi:SAM-dependent methyltransferase